MKAKVRSLRRADHQHNKTDQLSGDRCHSRTGDAHAKAENHNGIENHIGRCAAEESNHRIDGTTLESKLIIYYKLTGHKRCANQDYTHVLNRFLHADCIRAQYICKRMCINVPEYGNQNAQNCSQ